MQIDFHSHYFDPASVRRAAQDIGIKFAFDRVGDSFDMTVADDVYGHLPVALVDVDRQLDDLSPAGLDGRVLLPPPFLLRYDLSGECAATWSRALNEGTMAAARTDPERLYGFATVPLQAPDLALTELAYAVEELGAHGVEIATHAGERELDDEGLIPFFKAVSSYELPLLVHPHDVAGLQRMRHHELRNLIGNPLETTLAAARLIFGRVLERVPGLKVILSHGGGAMPYLIGRLAHGWQVRLNGQPAAPDGRSFDSHIRSLYFDTVLFDSRPLRYLIDIVSAEHLVLGTDYPFDMSEQKPVERLRETSSDAEVATILAKSEKLVNVRRSGQLL
jgi:aminocarboxymuconate-semialdehyde decarboxylase